MTGLVRVVFDQSKQTVDLATDSRGFIDTSGSFEVVVFLSLFTDARDDDRKTDRRGWWGDAHARQSGDRFGSKLWTLRRSPLVQDTIRRAQLFAEQALDWMVTDGIAKSRSVVAEIPASRNAIHIQPRIVRADGTAWTKIWDLHGKEVRSGVS